MICLTAALVVGLTAARGSFAQGTNTSAGDQQYIDPLTNTNTTSTAPSAQPSSSSPTTPSTSAPTPSPTGAAGGSASSPSPGPSSGSSGTLPFTGLNVEALVVVGIGLIGGGLVLRRAIGSR